MEKQLIGSVHIIREITETRQLEKERKDLEDLMTCVTHGLVELDERGSIRTWNRGTETLLGYSENEVKGKFFDKIILPEDMRESYEEILAAVCADGQVKELETEGLMKDGNTIPVSVTLGAKHNHHGKMLGIRVFIRDIRDKKEDEEKRVQVAKDLAMKGVVEKVGNFFENILEDILDRLDSDVEESKETARTEDIKAIEQTALEGMAMVRKLRKFSEKGDEDGFGRVNTQHLFDELSALTKEKWAEDIEAKGIQIEVSEDQRKLPAIKGDKGELREAFIHIISNAMEAMGPGGTLTLKSRTDREWVSISIKDTGIGMKTREKRRAFDPFYSGRGPEREGMGLTLSQWVVRRHGGEILINSERGRGTTVMVRLPVSEKG
jgi:PAS domain S-box-containing protein